MPETPPRQTGADSLLWEGCPGAPPLWGASPPVSPEAADARLVCV